MKLRTQLLLAGAVTLLLPLVAFRTVQQMDTALRDTRAFEVSKSTDSIRALLEHSGYLPQIDSGTVSDVSRDLYAEAISHRIVLDGYDDEWINQRLPKRQFTFADNKTTAVVVEADSKTNASLSLRLAASSSQLHLLIEVEDQQVVYHQPSVTVVGSEFSAPVEEPREEPIASGDHVIVYSTDSHGHLQETVFRAIAPGPVTGRRYGTAHLGIRPHRQVQRFRGSWTATNEGYQLELSLPLPPVNSAFGLVVIDRDVSTPKYRREPWIGTVDPLNSATVGKLVYSSADIESLLDEVVPKGSRARIFDMHGRLRADMNRLYQRPANPALLDPARSHFFNALLFRFFEWVIKTRRYDAGAGFPLSNPYKMRIQALTAEDIADPLTRVDDDSTNPYSVQRYVNQERDQVMGSLVRIASPEHTDMYLLFETNEDTANAFTSSAMVRMFSLVTLVGLLVAASLFAYATWLSWRIRRLSLQAKSAVSGDGRFLGAIKESQAADEIGEMSRSFAQLVERSAGYTQYLESLASKLSHELRTPLSVVQTSLENIESGEFDESDRLLLARAQGGASQLNLLIRSMSEAARLEQTVQHSEFVRFDAVSWLDNVRDTYSEIFARHAFTCESDRLSSSHLVAVPELLQQALDKLISNAVDFSETGSEITIVAVDAFRTFDLSVINFGAQLDESRVEQLFEPMFSSRSKQTGESHLGLGLYIVRLIAEAHGGQVYARNLVGQNAVQIGFSVLRREQV